MNIKNLSNMNMNNLKGEWKMHGNDRRSNNAYQSAAAPPRPPSSVGSADSRSKINPSTQAYRTRRSAQRLLEKLQGMNPAHLTEKERGSLIWAKANANIRPPNTSLSTATQKRERSVEPSTHSAPPNYKIPKIATPQKLHAVTERPTALDGSIWGVIDEGSSDFSISRPNWRKVDLALLQVFLEVMSANPGPSPTCRDAGWYRGGVKLIACSDQRSSDLYKLALEKLGELWPGAKLKFVPKEQIPYRPRFKAWVPAEMSTAEEILQLLKLSNLELQTHEWKVLKVGEPVDGFREILIIITEESLATIEKRRGEINYGFSSITLCASKYETDEPTADATTDAAAIIFDDGVSVHSSGGVSVDAERQLNQATESQDSPSRTNDNESNTATSQN